MKTSIPERLDALLDVNPDESTAVMQVTPAEVSSADNPDVDLAADYEFVRKTLYSIVEKGQDLLDSSIGIAKQKDEAKMYEATAMILKNVTESAKELIELHKSRKAIEKTSGANSNKGDQTTNNAIFFGTTGELLKMARETFSKPPLLNSPVVEIQPDGEPE